MGADSPTGDCLGYPPGQHSSLFKRVKNRTLNNGPSLCKIPDPSRQIVAGPKRNSLDIAIH